MSLPNGNGQAVVVFVGAPADEQAQVGQVRGPDGKLYVAIQFRGAHGIDAHWLEGAVAIALGEHMAKLGRPTQAGLEVAPGG